MALATSIGVAPFGPTGGAATSGGGGGGGTDQKQPKSYKVGTTSGAPTAGASTWTLADFAGSYVALFMGNSGLAVPFIDPGDGSPYLTKVLASSTITITNYAWGTGDMLTYILITPTP